MRLKYWFNDGLKMAGAVIAASFVYSIMTAFMMDDSQLWGTVSSMALFLFLMNIFISMALNTSIYRSTVSLNISFGSTRKETFWGLQCYRATLLIIPTVISFVLLAVMVAYRNNLDFPVWLVLPAGVGFYLLCTAFGMVFGILSIDRLKPTTAAILMFLSWCVACAALGVGLYFLGSATRNGYLLVFLFLAVGILAYGLALIPEHRALKKFTVKL